MTGKRIFGVAVTTAIAGVGISLGIFGGGDVLGASSANAQPAVTHVHASRLVKSAAQRTVHIFTEIETGKMLHKPGWPKYTHADWSAPAGSLVVFTIRSYDTGTAPLSPDSPYGKVLGTVGNVERVDGHVVRSIADKDVSHTFTLPGFGLNIVIPAAPAGKTVTVVASFRVPDKAGVYDWQCEAPCGTTASGWGGPMLTPGWMQGQVTVR